MQATLPKQLNQNKLLQKLKIFLSMKQGWNIFEIGILKFTTEATDCTSHAGLVTPKCH